ncbi:hypothetical protein ACJJTC_001425 [Scirpophaga incertulas]
MSNIKTNQITESNVVKSRTPSRCREWERQRRNKFNEAIAKLGNIIKELGQNKEDSTCKSFETVQYSKIEIIQKAIISLSSFIQEKTQLKAEILALQVELDIHKNKTRNMKDASSQVFMGTSKKTQSSKYMKSIKLQKTKKKPFKDKTQQPSSPAAEHKKLLKLLPRSHNSNVKKNPENTIVVLPATPYIFHQRPLLFPTLPPAIVLVDPNMQSLKTPAPVGNRISADITKTTMVNILPISAYSHALSATKNKKNIRQKKENSKKTNVPSKQTDQVNNFSEQKKPDDINLNEVNDTSSTKNKDVNANQDVTAESEKLSETNKSSKVEVPLTNNVEATENKLDIISKVPASKNNERNREENVNADSKTDSNDLKNEKLSSIDLESGTNVEASNENNLNKVGKKSLMTDKISTTLVKDKENKLPNILENTLCDTVVDGGNARLELAEEFLAASPTAAFLMSFPLVSGNRADSPADEHTNTVQNSGKDNNQKRNEVLPQTQHYFDKNNLNETKLKSKVQTSSLSKHNQAIKYSENYLISKQIENKITNVVTNSATASQDNPFLNLSMPSLISSNCTTASDIGVDFECNKAAQNQVTNYASNNNFFYKSDHFNTVKNTIYSTSSISSGHDFNNLGLYPCAMEKYSSKNKCEYSNVEENFMKIGSSRLTYDIDLGWSHKSFDFVNCTTSSNAFNKDSIITNVSAPYSTSYNPFNPEFHMPLVSNSTKKDNFSSKPTTSFTDSITSFYSQSNLWSDDTPFYTNNNVTKIVSAKQQICQNNLQANSSLKSNDKIFNSSSKQAPVIHISNGVKAQNNLVEPQVPEKFSKKSPSKTHINWMTSETRQMEPNYNSIPVDIKDSHKTSYTQLNHAIKKQNHNESYFPLSMHNFVSHPTQEEFQVMFPASRTVGPTEITMEPPPINLPTLVGDLALGPHDKKKNSEGSNRTPAHPQDIQNCNTFLSVTQLMNRSSDMSSRFQTPSIDPGKANNTKQINPYFSNDISHKSMSSRLDSQLPQPCYGFPESKLTTYDMGQFPNSKIKTSKSDKSSKTHKNSYSAEALIRGGNCTQKIQDNSAKFVASSQKHNEFNTPQDSTIAQVSHFPPILDYSDNTYASQQFSGTGTLYNTTTNTISNSFYTNFMPTSGNLMSSNYTNAPFSGEFIDYNQSECNYTNHMRPDEFKMRNNSTAYHPEKVLSNYKSSRRDSATKHKLECNKKDSSKKYQSKRAKMLNEVDEWNDTSHLLWQNKASNKRHVNLVADELSFPNYVGNQMPAQYQPEFFNSHLMPSNIQSVGHNIDKSLSFPVTSRANFNLSTIFPEITMVSQNKLHSLNNNN